MAFFSSRTASLILSFLGALGNLYVAVLLLSLWRSLKWESESEWDESGVGGGLGVDGWRVHGLKLIWGLLSAYFATAAVACVVGVIGVLWRIPSYVRLYRDYSVADICFSAFSTVLFALASFRPTIRQSICEELSGQPELLRDLAEAGLNLENCEQWFEHAVVAVLGVTAVLLVVRLQFILTVSNFYRQLLRQKLYSSIQLCDSPLDDESPHRIYLLPARSSISSSSPQGPTNPNSHHHHISSSSSAVQASLSASSGKSGSTCGGVGGGDKKDNTKNNNNKNVLIYAPVPLSSLSEEEARELEATEAWVSRAEPSYHHHHPHHRRSHHSLHSRSHSHSSSHSTHSHSASSHRRHSRSRSQQQLQLQHQHQSPEALNGQGKINLPIRSGEGLLPSYTEANPNAVVDGVLHHMKA